MVLLTVFMLDFREHHSKSKFGEIYVQQWNDVQMMLTKIQGFQNYVF